MGVSVKTGSVLKSLLGGELEVQSEGNTIGEVLDSLGIRDRVCDASGAVRRHFNIHVNDGEDVRLQQGLDTVVKDGDSVTILSAIAGGAEASRKVWLTFPQNLVDRPILWEVGQKFKVVTNVRQASVSKDIAVVGLELTGEVGELEKALAFLKETGLGVDPIEMNVVE